MSKAYTPADWYWRHADGRVYASAALAVVPETDPGYVEFIATGAVASDWPQDETGAQTDAALAAELARWGIAATVTAARASRIAAAWAECDRRCETESVEVTTSVGTYSYGIDAATRQNLQMAVIGLLAGLQTFPRPWTPKGAAVAISITADDLKLIASSVGAAYDARVQAYLVHKAAIKALTTAAAIAAHDLSAGWPP